MWAVLGNCRVSRFFTVLYFKEFTLEINTLADANSTGQRMMRIFGCFSPPSRVQFRRGNIAFILFIACCGIAVVLYFSINGMVGSSPQLNTEYKKTLRVKYVKQVGNYSSACRLPNLDPFHPSILEFVKDLGKLRCTGERYSTFVNNVLEVKGDGFATVQYRTIERPRGDDFNVTLSAPKSLLNMAEKTKESPIDEGRNILYTLKPKVVY